MADLHSSLFLLPKKNTKIGNTDIPYLREELSAFCKAKTTLQINEALTHLVNRFMSTNIHGRSTKDKKLSKQLTLLYENFSWAQTHSKTHNSKRKVILFTKIVQLIDSIYKQNESQTLSTIPKKIQKLVLT